MPKIFKPEVAEPIDEVLMEIARCFMDFGDDDTKCQINEPPAKVSAAIDYVRSHVNSNVCLAAVQKKAVIKDFRDLDYDRLNTSVLQRLISVINTMHFDCANCLNNVCGHRDPVFIYESVAARAQKRR